MTSNQQILDNSISHQVDLQFYSNSVVNRIIALLNRTDADLFEQVTSALDRLPKESFTVERLDAILASVRDLNAQAYRHVSNELNGELREFVAQEAAFQKDLFDDAIKTTVLTSSISAEQVYTAALARPFQGRLLREWLTGIEGSKAVKLRDAIRMGYVENQTVSEIVKRLRGTRALNYKDGILEITRRDAETVTRTAISHMASFTRERFFEANASVIKAIKWHSTLDARTSEVCRARDGKIYSKEHKPIGHSLSWLGGPGNAHFNCRSVGVAVTKSYKDLGINADSLSPATRASMDGQVPSDLTYGDWLKTKDKGFQDNVLGKTKAQLFRAGMAIEKFENNKGKELTLAQLKERSAYYFKKAGV
jgi:SPP1 gp7 family putative phage head morphogenesis protein